MIQTDHEGINKAAALIWEVYKLPNGGVGGYGHIVFDDENYDCVDGCLDDALENKYPELGEEVRQASIKALIACQSLSEREIAIACEIMHEANW